MTFALLKIRLESLKQSMFGRMNKKNKKLGKLAKLLIALLVIYVVGALGLSLTFTFSQLAASFLPLGLGWLYFAMVGLLTSCLSLVSTIFMSNSQIFEAKDNDLLLSMPIKPGVILASRVLVIVLINFAYTFVISLCAQGVFVAKSLSDGTFRVSQIFVTLGAVVLIALFATALGCACGWLIGLVLSKTSAKNIVVTVMSFAFLFVYMYVFINLQGNMMALIERGEEFARAIRDSLPPFYHFGVACYSASPRSLGILALWSLTPFAAVCALLRLSFMRIVTSKRGERQRKYRAKPLKSSSAVSALRRKELARFFTTPMYMLNCGLGSVMMIMFAVALTVKGESLLNMLLGIPSMGEMLPGIIIAVMCFFALMNTTSSVVISLEGKSFPLLKSLPVGTRSVFLAKSSVNLIIGLPAIAVCAVLCRVAVTMNTLQTVMLFVLPCMAQVLSTVWGLAANLWFPRFDWVNETMLVKQSGSALISVFGGMGIMALPVIVYALLLRGSVSLDAFLVICAGFFAALCSAVIIYLSTSGRKLYESL